jgi:hypothetical protein
MSTCFRSLEVAANAQNGITGRDFQQKLAPQAKRRDGNRFDERAGVGTGR